MVQSFMLMVATTIAQGAVVLAVVGGILGIMSIFVVLGKLRSFDEIAEKQKIAVDELDVRVNRIEGKLHRDEA